MNELDNKKLICVSLTIIFSVAFALILFFPLGAYFFSFLILAFIANSKKSETKQLLFIAFIFIVIIAIIVNENSVQKFIFREDDFTTYYNNYLDMLNGNFGAFFEFGGGFEIGLPVLNYIFSAVLNEPLPYIIQVFYVLIFMVMLYYLVAIDKQFIIKRRANRYMLFLWGVALLKITAMLTIERQAIASFFVLFAISEPRKRFFWLLIGCFFHLSTPIIYFVIRYILRTKTYKRVLLSSFALIAFVSFSYQILTILNGVIPNDKIGFVLYFLSDNDLVNNEIAKSLKQIAYITPLLLLDFILRLKGIKWPLGPSLLLFSLSMLILSILPGVPTRLMMPIIFILFGFYYYSFFSLFTNRTQICTFLLIAFCLTVYKFFLPGYYYRYPLTDFYPGYYVNYFMEEYNYTKRPSLPSMADTTIDNGNKL